MSEERDHFVLLTKTGNDSHKVLVPVTRIQFAEDTSDSAVVWIREASGIRPLRVAESVSEIIDRIRTATPK